MTAPSSTETSPVTLIIGGGLSGLWAAILLHRDNIPFLLLEARPELGGRIQTAFVDGHPFDLGPSWYWPETQPLIAHLVARSHLEHYAQFTKGDAVLEEEDRPLRREARLLVDPRQPQRLVGGTRTLIDHLLSKLPPPSILTEHQVSSISDQDEHLVVEATSPAGPSQFRARNVILALPPRLLARHIHFDPELPAPIMEALHATPTWMAGDAKFFALYDKPFWRSEDLAGTAYSDLGPLSEVQDASLPNGPAALLGFLHLNRQERLHLGDQLVPACLEQLTRYFGPAAGQPVQTILHDWSTEALTAVDEDVPLFEHPVFGLPSECQGLWRNKLHFAGTETDFGQGGYMEGALQAAERAVRTSG